MEGGGVAISLPDIRAAAASSLQGRIPRKYYSSSKNSAVSLKIEWTFSLQVSLYNILSKFNGVTEKEYKTYKDNFLKRFEITRLPRFVSLKRNRARNVAKVKGHPKSYFIIFFLPEMDKITHIGREEVC